jgi:hypothetical protein
MQNHTTASSPGVQLVAAHGPELFVEATHRFGSSLANIYYPPLRIRSCRICDRQVLLVRLGSRRDFWVETIEPSMPWIEIGIPLGEFLYLVGLSQVHTCTPVVAPADGPWTHDAR